MTAALPATSIWGAAGNDVWANGSAGVEHWDGHEWAPVSALAGGSQWGTPTTGAVAGSSSTDVWLSGWFSLDSNPVFMVHWNGNSFEPIQFNDLMGVATDLWVASPTDAWATVADTELAAQCGPGDVASNGIYHWDGTAWTQVPEAVGGGWEGVWGTSADNVYLLGNGAILHHKP